MRHVFLISTVLILMLAVGPTAARSQNDPDTFSPKQYRWAVNWINGPLETLMAHGVIERIFSADKTFRIQAGEGWEQLSFKQAGELMSCFSRARQITGHSPFFTVKQAETEIVLGRITQTSITLLVPDEGYFEYFPSKHNRENTQY